MWQPQPLVFHLSIQQCLTYSHHKLPWHIDRYPDPNSDLLYIIVAAFSLSATGFVTHMQNPSADVVFRFLLPSFCSCYYSVTPPKLFSYIFIRIDWQDWSGFVLYSGHDLCALAIMKAQLTYTMWTYLSTESRNQLSEDMACVAQRRKHTSPWWSTHSYEKYA